MRRQSQKENNEDSQLPAVYVNPWLTLIVNIKAIIVDLFFRVRFFYTSNSKHQKKKIIVSIAVIIILSLALIFLNSSSKMKNSLLNETPLKEESQNSNNLFDMESLDKSINKIEATSDLKGEELIIENQIQLTRKSLIFNPAMDLLKEDKFLKNFPKGLILYADLSRIDNGIVFTVSSEWDGLSKPRRESLCFYIQNLFEEFGYRELQINDNLERLVAKTSRLGSGMILYDRSLK